MYSNKMSAREIVFDWVKLCITIIAVCGLLLFAQGPRIVSAEAGAVESSSHPGMTRYTQDKILNHEIAKESLDADEVRCSVLIGMTRYTQDEILNNEIAEESLDPDDVQCLVLTGMPRYTQDEILNHKIAKESIYLNDVESSDLPDAVEEKDSDNPKEEISPDKSDMDEFELEEPDTSPRA